MTSASKTGVTTAHSTSIPRQSSQTSHPASESNNPINDQSHLRQPSKEVLDFNAQGSFHTTDGRVRNPVPHKLQGMADDKNGNFSVMHIDLASAEMSERNAAAKRTSEGTEAAARLANMSGYQAVKRNKLAWPPQEHGIGLNPHDTKAEQARLLTLLRSVHPVAVVDQLCKALAYFGGIPGAPAPNDVTSFPQSATVNGPGSLFIGWVGEIFPAVGGTETAAVPPSSDGAGQVQQWTRPSQPQGQSSPKQGQSLPLSQPPPIPKPQPKQQHQPTNIPTQDTIRKEPTPIKPANESQNEPEGDTPVKRGRGRPKGSMGIKKRELEAAMAAGGQAVDGQPPGSSDPNARSWSAQPATQSSESAPVLTPSGKRRGRPKGSKNKPKNAQQAGPADIAHDSDQSVNAHTSDVTGSPMINDGQFPFGTSSSAAAADNSTARTAMGPSGYVVSGNWSGSVSQNAHGLANSSSNPHAPTQRKRKGRKTSEDNSAPNSANTSFGNNQPQPAGHGPGGNNAKRRRASKEAHPTPAFSAVDNQQTNHAGLSGSPVQNQGVIRNSGSPAAFGTPHMANRQNVTGAMAQNQHMQQQHQHHQQFHSPQPAQTRPPHAANPNSNQTHNAMVNARSGGQIPYAQAGMNLTPQELYAQHQQQQQQNYSARMSQSNSAASGFGKNDTGKSPVFQQNMNRPGSMDANMAAATNSGQAPGSQHQAAQLAREAANRAPHNFDNRQAPAGLHPSYGDQQAYMTMDYSGLGDRNMQGAAGFNASPAQLNATMSDMRSRMQRSQGR